MPRPHRRGLAATTRRDGGSGTWGLSHQTGTRHLGCTMRKRKARPGEDRKPHSRRLPDPRLAALVGSLCPALVARPAPCPRLPRHRGHRCGRPAWWRGRASRLGRRLSCRPAHGGAAALPRRAAHGRPCDRRDRCGKAGAGCRAGAAGKRVRCRAPIGPSRLAGRSRGQEPRRHGLLCRPGLCRDRARSLWLAVVGTRRPAAPARLGRPGISRSCRKAGPAA